jgi:hypothetical protein
MHGASRDLVPPVLLLALSVALAGCDEGSPEEACAEGWEQFSSSPGHGGVSCASGQPLATFHLTAVVDEHVAAERNEWGGALLVHYQTPLVSGDDVVVEHKGGDYVPCDGGPPDGCGPAAWHLQIWGERAYRWNGGVLEPAWSFDSDWKPPPWGPSLTWEPVFHAALAGEDGELVAIPGAGGTLHLVSRATGALERTVDPFDRDPDVYVAGAVAADAAGNAWYTAIRLDPTDPWGDSGRDAEGFLCRVTPGGAFTVLPFEDLVDGAPAPDDACETAYSSATTPRPWPPLDGNGDPLPAPTVRCGAQRPQLNAAPAIAEDGTIFVVSRAHRAPRTGFVVAVGPDLEPRWATSLRGRLVDGCGVLVPYGAGCTEGAPLGVDPSTGTAPAGQVSDLGTSSPVALPDGGALYGAFTGYNGSRGHLFRLGPEGDVIATYDFGWDITPAVFEHDGTWSVVLKDNHYAGNGPYDLAQLDADLEVEWRLASPETLTCRRTGGDIECVDTGEHPLGFEWCVNAVAVDRHGVVYANAEDGYLYAVEQGGHVRDRIFLDEALGAAYTPVSLDEEGRVYAQNAGKLFVVGGP